MENFKQASKVKLRFQTNKGVLTTEQLWDLSLSELDSLAVSLEAAHDRSARKSFLAKSSDKDRTAKLRFDVVLDVLNTRAAEEEAATTAKENKEYNSKIIALIAEKQNESLKGKSVEELEAMLKN